VRVWIDLANSPHVPLAKRVAVLLGERGHQVLVTARDHAQTIGLGKQVFPDLEVVGGPSPPGRFGKALGIARRAEALRRVARRERPDVAFSHGSYAQVVAARLSRVPAVTMMDYEYQPANHLSFRLARRVIVPTTFPDDALRRFGAPPRKVVRYDGFKEELYLEGFRADAAVLDELGLDRDRVIAVFRPPPEGALYHRMGNVRFDELLSQAVNEDDVQVVVLPRNRDQAERYRRLSPEVRVPSQAVDGRSLLAFSDVVVGAGGTMNREAAILGAPTYTVFAGELAAVDAALVEQGKMVDLREGSATPAWRRGTRSPDGSRATGRGRQILDTVVRVLEESGAHDRRPRAR
jgi:uncharacterized protein